MDFTGREFGKNWTDRIVCPPSALSGADQREKLVARLLIVTESAKHGASHRRAMLFFHAAHLHAEVAGFDNHSDTLRSNFFLDGFRDLARYAFLNLQAARKHVDHA